MPKRKAKKATSRVENYENKRNFRKTPEPLPGSATPGTGAPVFVVHRHEARRLHYDLRIEVDGVLKSWAVPKGFSYDPAEKRLAVRTEDHPLEYEDFQGVIPPGEYGAGTMTIWDRGSYELISAVPPLDAIEKGKLEIRFYGGRLRGEWHMVKLKKASAEWLLFKSRDRYAREKGSPAFAIDLTRISPKPLPQRVRPMRIGETVPAFNDPAWIYELKLEGARVLVEYQNDSVRFRGTRRKLSARLPEVTADLKKLKAERALLDGVLVCLDDQQRPSESLLEQVLAGQADRPVVYYAFDLLHYEDWDLRQVPLLERKAALASILPTSNSVVYVEHERSRSQQLILTVQAVGLAGCVAKRADSTYAAGPSPNWVEIALVPAPRTSQDDLLQALAQRTENSRKLPGAVRFTNLDKVLWPRDGYTKGDLIRYYDDVADALLPYLQDRPLSLHRFPDGIEGESFFQKNSPGYFPDWVPTAEVTDSSGRRRVVRYVVCNDRKTLLYLANLASVELHPWSSRVGTFDSPDWAILDLDPSVNDFRKVARVARLLGKILRGIGLRPFLKTSGSKGLHIYIPLLPGYSYDQVRMFCEGVALCAVHELPEVATVERGKTRRGQKVYLDYLQNRRGQTIAAPYTVRPIHGAPVSAPLTWDEVSEDVDPSDFTIQTMPARLASHGDLFREALTDRQDLLPAIEALGKRVSSES